MPTTEDARGGYAKGRARREEIVRAAAHLFATGGFTGTSMVDISAAVGISRAGILHHFEDKVDLLTAVLTQREREDRVVFQKHGAGGATGIGILRGIVALARQNTGRKGLVSLYVRLAAEATDSGHPAHEYFVAHYRRVRAGTAEAFRRAETHGLLNPGVDPADAGIRLVALQEGLQILWLAEPETVDVASELEIAIESSLRCRLWG